MHSHLKEIMDNFDILGVAEEAFPYGKGHINDTYKVITRLEDGGERKYILQRINHTIFKKPHELMDNIQGVTEHIREKVRARGGDLRKESLHVILTKNGENHVEVDGNFYRVYDFIMGAKTYQMVEGPADFYKSGQALGEFQELLFDCDATSLHETIKDFHNTEKRFEDFREVIKEDPKGRLKGCQEDVEGYLLRKKDVGIINKLIRNKEIPIRVTHNDTKYNNVMIDDVTREAVCMIDLDTVMPGVSLYDFGDSIRSGATTALEDEADLSKVNLDLELFKAYTAGYLSKGDFLTETEIDYLPFAAKLLTFECGMRFLKDYLEGDIYYKTDYDTHNLVRARNQFKLVLDMERDYQQMIEIVKEIRKA